MIINKIQESYIQFVPNKPFVSLLQIPPKNQIFLKTFHSEFPAIEVWFTDQIIGFKIADKITKSSRQLHLKKLNPKTDDNETEIPKKRYISPEKKGKKLLMN